MFGISIRNFQLVKRSSALYLYRRLVSVFSIMADGGGDEKPFLVEYASQGRAKCKTCKLQIEKTTTRIGKLVSNPFSEDGGMMKHWYHVPCIFDSLSRARATTKKIESTDDLDGFGKLKDDDQAKIVGLITGLYSLGQVRPCQVKGEVRWGACINGNFRVLRRSFWMCKGICEGQRSFALSV